MNKKTLEEIAEKVNLINTLKCELEHLLEEVENADFEDCMREYCEAIDEAENYVFDTFKAYESDCKFDALEWMY